MNIDDITYKINSAIFEVNRELGAEIGQISADFEKWRFEVCAYLQWFR